MPSWVLRPCLSPSGMVFGSPHEVGHTCYVLTAQIVGCCWWCLIRAFISHPSSGFPYSVQCLFRLFGMSGCLVNSNTHTETPYPLLCLMLTPPCVFYMLQCHYMLHDGGECGHVCLVPALVGMEGTALSVTYYSILWVLKLFEQHKQILL